MIIPTELQHTKVTLAQAIALHRVYGRCKLYVSTSPEETMLHNLEPMLQDANASGITFEEFVSHCTVITDEVIMVPWCGMWLGIELDGHTHS